LDEIKIMTYNEEMGIIMFANMKVGEYSIIVSLMDEFKYGDNYLIEVIVID